MFGMVIELGLSDTLGENLPLADFLKLVSFRQLLTAAVALLPFLYGLNRLHRDSFQLKQKVAGRIQACFFIKKKRVFAIGAWHFLLP